MAALKAISSIVGLQIFGAGTAFAVVLVMTGALGPEGYGRYVWVLSMAGVGSLLLQRGLPMTLVKTFAPFDFDSLTPPSPIANTLVLYVLASVAALGLALPLMLILPAIGLQRPEIAWALPVAAALACLEVSDAILRSAERGVRAQFASQVLRSGGLLGACALLAAAGVSEPDAYLALYAGSALMAALAFTWPLLPLAARKWRGCGSVPSTSAHFHVAVSRSIGNHLPVFITGFFVSPETLAYLAIAVRLTGPILFGSIASRAYFGARINRHVKSDRLDAAERDYRWARIFSTAVGALAALFVLALIWGLTLLPNGPLEQFTATNLLLTLFVLVTVFRLSLAVFGPVQMVAILLGADHYVRNLNLGMLSLLTLGLVVAGLLNVIWLSAGVMIAYAAILGLCLDRRVSRLLHEGKA